MATGVAQRKTGSMSGKYQALALSSWTRIVLLTCAQQKFIVVSLSQHTCIRCFAALSGGSASYAERSSSSAAGAKPTARHSLFVKRQVCFRRAQKKKSCHDFFFFFFASRFVQFSILFLFHRVALTARSGTRSTTLWILMQW